jgi:hypothetical protein
MIKKTKKKLLKRKINLIRGGSSKPSTTKKKFTNFFKGKPKLTEEEKKKKEEEEREKKEEKKKEKKKKEEEDREKKEKEKINEQKRKNMYKRQQVGEFISEKGRIEMEKQNMDTKDINLDPVDFMLYAPDDIFEKNDDFNEIIQYQYEFLTYKIISTMNDKLCSSDFSKNFPMDKYIENLKKYKNKFQDGLKYNLIDIPLSDIKILDLNYSKFKFKKGELREEFIKRNKYLIDNLRKYKNPLICSKLSDKCEKIVL